MRALLATLALIALIFMITWSNRARDEALGWERRTNEVMLLTRTIDATIARSEAALGRYVLDEERDTGTAYYNEWRNAGWQIGQLAAPAARTIRSSARRVAELRALFVRRDARARPRGAAPPSAARARRPLLSLPGGLVADAARAARQARGDRRGRARQSRAADGARRRASSPAPTPIPNGSAGSPS